MRQFQVTRLVISREENKARRQKYEHINDELADNREHLFGKQPQSTLSNGMMRRQRAVTMPKFSWDKEA